MKLDARTILSDTKRTARLERQRLLNPKPETLCTRASRMFFRTVAKPLELASKAEEPISSALGYILMQNFALVTFAYLLPEEPSPGVVGAVTMGAFGLMAAQVYGVLNHYE